MTPKQNRILRKVLLCKLFATFNLLSSICCHYFTKLHFSSQINGVLVPVAPADEGKGVQNFSLQANSAIVVGKV